MTIDEFTSLHDGKFLDYDKLFGNQCVDLVAFYTRDVHGCSGWACNANEIYELFPAPLPTFFNRVAVADGKPKKGDIMVWGESIGPNGHTAIYLGEEVGGFISFDQNWKLGTPCHVQTHTWQGVEGWLTPKGDDMGPDVTSTDQARHIYLEYGIGVAGDDPALVRAVGRPELELRRGIAATVLNNKNAQDKIIADLQAQGGEYEAAPQLFIKK